MNFDTFFKLVGAIASIIAILGVTVSLFRFFIVKLIQARKEEFERYHRIVYQLNADIINDAAPYIDMQTAAVFELTLMRKYYPVSIRILKNRLNSTKNSILSDEIRRAINIMERKRYYLF